jgi:hypothetical protein
MASQRVACEKSSVIEFSYVLAGVISPPNADGYEVNPITLECIYIDLLFVFQ